MVYQRTRNSRYSSYARNCEARGTRAQFSIPLGRTANFNPMLDVLNQGMQMGGDMFGHAGQAIQDLAGRGVDVPYAPNMGGLGAEIGSRLGDAAQGAQDGIGQAAQGIGSRLSGMVQGVGDYFSGNPNAANAAKAAAGVTGIAGGAAAGGRAIRAMGPQGAQMAEEVAPAVMGLRQKAGALLKNPYAQAGAGAAALGAGAYGANQMMNRDQ